jgi:hypothetical protein
MDFAPSSPPPPSPRRPNSIPGAPDACLDDLVKHGPESEQSLPWSFVVAFCRLTLERPRLKTETSAQRRTELSACGIAVMSRMSFSSQYTLSAPSVEGVGKVSRSVAAMTTFWLALVKAGHDAPMVDGGVDVPGSSSGVGEVYRYDSLYLECGLVVM